MSNTNMPDLFRLQEELAEAYERLDIVRRGEALAQMQEQMLAPDFWQDSSAAQKISKQAAASESQLKPWQNLKQELDELLELVSIDDSLDNTEVTAQLGIIEAKFNSLKVQLRYSGAYDSHDVILAIHAGAGGTDAMDWAQMLLRMYTRWAEKTGAKATLIEESRGEEAGIKSVSIAIEGQPYIYGRLKGEHGVHRLVRLSPFNSDNLRQTSFAKVEVLPSIDSPDAIQLDPKELRIDTFRSGGNGGQSVNTTDSAVRITHISTGISVSIQNEKSQLQNKETAMKVLSSRLAQLQLEQHAATISEIKGPNQANEWGSQIRNYVLHPYKLVKDVRTNEESSDPDKVLDGSIDSFIDAYLEYALGKE